MLTIHDVLYSKNKNQQLTFNGIIDEIYSYNNILINLTTKLPIPQHNLTTITSNNPLSKQLNIEYIGSFKIYDDQHRTIYLEQNHIKQIDFQINGYHLNGILAYQEIDNLFFNHKKYYNEDGLEIDQLFEHATDDKITRRQHVLQTLKDELISNP